MRTSVTPLSVFLKGAGISLRIFADVHFLVHRALRPTGTTFMCLLPPLLPLYALRHIGDHHNRFYNYDDFYLQAAVL